MPIEDVLALPRKEIAWYGTEPDQDAIKLFIGSDFYVNLANPVLGDADMSDQARLDGLCAVVFAQDVKHPRRVVSHLSCHADKLLDHDVRVVVRSPTGTLTKHLVSLIGGARSVTGGRLPISGLQLAEGQPTTVAPNAGEAKHPLPHVRVFGDGETWRSIADHLLRFPASQMPQSALAISNPPEFTASEQTLLRRAFFDCTEVRLEEISEGRSRARVFRAHAKRSGVNGQCLTPFFVKVGPRADILREFRNYQDAVDPYLPFYLCPQLVHERCHLGAVQGVIVGDWVDNSESLAHCIAAHRGSTALSCIFDRTFRGWHSDARDDESKALGDWLLPLLPERIPNTRMARASELGALLSLDDLKDFFRTNSNERVLVGPIHGDLHASNVHVRAGDAIAIDFFAHKRGPLLLDPAMLEASLLVDCEGGKWDGSRWFSSVSRAYDHAPLARPLEYVDPDNPWAWFHATVRQIRLFAQEMQRSPGQYALALAAALLRKSGKDPDADEPEATRRAAAYAFAERILTQKQDTQ